MQYFLDDFQSEQPSAFRDRRAIVADAQLVMIASTGTLSTLLTHCFYYLAKHPDMRDQLREEISSVLGKSCPGEFAYRDLSSLPLLDSVISETLRMHSPTCNGGPRVTIEDTIIEGTVIRKGVKVYVGIHSIQRSEQHISIVRRMTYSFVSGPDYFVYPDEWIPERWTSRPDLILDKRAYHPFLTGELVYMERFFLWVHLTTFDHDQVADQRYARSTQLYWEATYLDGSENCALVYCIALRLQSTYRAGRIVILKWLQESTNPQARGAAMCLHGDNTTVFCSSDSLESTKSSLETRVLTPKKKHAQHQHRCRKFQKIVPQT